MGRFNEEEQELLRHLYYDLEYSIPMIKKIIQADDKTLRDWVRKLGTPRNRSEAQYVALKHRRKNNPRGKESHLWQGGSFLSTWGYVLITLRPEDPFFEMANRQRHQWGAYIFEHRYIMAKHLNRCLTNDEIVHHLNGVRTDNRIANLALTHRSNHSTNTLSQLLQKRIRELESELAQKNTL